MTGDAASRTVSGADRRAGRPLGEHDGRSTGRRRDIEALRGVAVLLVVLYHVGVPGFRGGYVGVDVFFVISGFLITGLMLDERRRDGRISLLGFYARRFRRILPLAVLALVATVVAAGVVLPALRRQSLADDARAVATFTMNLRLMDVGADYLRAGVAASPLQHYWSLAVEEQFYLVWPICLAALLALARGRRAVAAGAALVLAGTSLWWSQRLLTDAPIESFFSLRSRLWEPLAGAFLAFTVRSLPAVPRRLAPWLGTAGLAALAWAVLTFDGATPFPGRSALVPVLGTAACIAAAGRGLAWVMSGGVLEWIGARSYGWYLFHWPAIVLAQAQFPDASVVLVGAVAAVGSLVLADVAHRAVELPLRRGRDWTGDTPTLLVGGGALIAASVLFSVVIAPYWTPSEAQAVPAPTSTAVAGGSSSSAPAVTDTVLPLADQLDEAALAEVVPAGLHPSLLAAAKAVPATYSDGCHLLGDAAEVPPGCSYGTGARRVLLFGDSHAAQWFPLLSGLAAEDGWTLTSRTKSGCAVVSAPVSPEWIGTGTFPSCDAWRDQVLADVRADPPDLVIVSVSDTYRLTTGEDTTSAAWSAAYSATLRTLAASTDVVLVGDTPRPSEFVPECLAAHPNRATACVRSVDDARQRGTEARERAVAADAGVPFLPTFDLVCGRRSCPVIIGDLLVYRDGSHITPDMAVWLTTAFRERLDATS